MRWQYLCIALLTLLMPIQAQAQCTNPSAPLGAIIFNEDHDVYQGCTTQGWWSFHEYPTHPCTETTSDPAIGETCTDGSYYIGDIGAGPVYATNESFESQQTWNDGNTNHSTTGVTSIIDGAGNTATLVTADSDDATGGVQPHDAAIYCDGLSAHGHNDWYLPARNELYLFWNSFSPVANVNESGFPPYWSSSELTDIYARDARFNNGAQAFTDKSNSLFVRCVRR